MGGGFSIRADDRGPRLLRQTRRDQVRREPSQLPLWVTSNQMLGLGVRGFCIDTEVHREPQKFHEKGSWGQTWYLKKVVGVIEGKAVFQGKQGLGRHVKRNSVHCPDSLMNLDLILSLFLVSKKGLEAPVDSQCFLLPLTKGPWYLGHMARGFFLFLLENRKKALQAWLPLLHKSL